MTTAETMFAQPGDGMMDRKQEARKVLWAFLAALFLHLVVAYSLATWGGIFSPALPVSEKPVELTIVDLSTPPPIAPKNSVFMETDESKQSAEQPKEKTFESSANSIGASFDVSLSTSSVGRPVRSASARARASCASSSVALGRRTTVDAGGWAPGAAGCASNGKAALIARSRPIERWENT